MILTINNQEYELKFGFAFIKKINQLMGLKDSDGAEMGNGLQRVSFMLAQEEPEAVATVIMAATDHLKKRPTGKEIESFWEEYADFEGLLKEIDESLSNATPLGVSKKYQKAKELIKQAEARVNSEL